MEKGYLIFLESADKNLKAADHLLYITYPVIKDNKIFIKIFELIHRAVRDSISAALLYDYSLKKIEMQKSFNENFEVFRRNFESYNITREEIMLIEEIFHVMDKHNSSALEFVRKQKFVIMDDGLELQEININKLKNYLILSKNLFDKVEKRLEA